MTAMFVNLPVTDLERAKAFHTAVGFTINFADHNAARVVEDGNLEFGYMDPVAAEQGPEAFLNQQA